MNDGIIDSPYERSSVTIKEVFVTLVKFEPDKDNFNGGDRVLVETAHRLGEYDKNARFSFDLPLAPAFSVF